MADTLFHQNTLIPAGNHPLEGILTIPREARSAVIFVHGSGSSRLSPRNTYVANVLNSAGIATLLFDLLTQDEDRFYENRFNIELLTGRLRAATLWLQKQPRFEAFSIGYFGASTGTAAALRAAADLGPEIRAVVSRGGRPDMAEDALSKVRVPVLLIVGGRDELVIELNQWAYSLIPGEKDLKTVAGATHLFEEPGALEEVARLAAIWFTRHLGAGVQDVRKRAS